MLLSTRTAVICMTLMALSSPSYAQMTGSDPAPSIPKSAAGLATSPAMRVYEGAVVDCFKTVTNVDPVEAARTKNMQALNMDPKIFLRIQDCMNEKGVPANFENYFAGKNKEGLSAAQRADLQAIQDTLDSNQTPAAVAGSVVAPMPVQAPPAVSRPVMPVPQAVIAPPPVPVTAPAVSPLPALAEPKADTGASGAATKTPRPAQQYWVKPE